MTQPGGPLGDLSGPIAARGKPLPQGATVSAYRSLDTGLHHPGKYLAGVRSELQLQQLLPDLFLRPAQEHDIADKTMRPGQHAKSEIQQLVQGRPNGIAVADIVAEINDAVALGKARSY